MAPNPKAGRGDLDYSDPEHILCQFSLEELEEISESLLFTRKHDPEVDKDYSLGLRKKVAKIIKRVRENQKTSLTKV